MSRRRTLTRVLLGGFVVMHALGHTVLLLRGRLEYPPATLTAAIAACGFTLALIALFAAGLGIIGSRVFGPHVRTLMIAGLSASTVALTLAWNDTSWWGLAFDAALTGAFAGARNTGLLAGTAPAANTITGRGRIWLREGVACVLVSYVAVGAAIWPWHRRWGTTAAERQLALPGDRVPRNPNYELMHAVTIDAPPEQVWKWLVQLGQDRAGFYSYDWLERLLLADVHNVFEIRGEWQRRAAGDFIRATPPNYLGGIFGRDVGWTVTHVEPGRVMVLANWGAFVLEPDEQGRTRSFIRSSIGAPDAPVWGAALTFTLFELPHFIMERKMMLTIKTCAERSARRSAAGQIASAH
jgi:uncharacterized protein YndB with AHSA1/START domain